MARLSIIKIAWILNVYFEKDELLKFETLCVGGGGNRYGSAQQMPAGYVRTFDSKLCHRTGIARSEGTGQGQRNYLCLASALSL